MPPRGKIDTLPEEVRSALDRRLIGGGFAGYVELAEWLADQGFEFGKSTVHRYGAALQRRLSSIRASTEAAKLIAAAAPDEADDRSNAIISLVQTEIFEALLALQEASEEEDPGDRIAILGKAAKNIATMTRASVARNKWAVELDVRRKAAKDGADAAEAAARQQGLSADTVAAIRHAVLGVGA